MLKDVTSQNLVITIPNGVKVKVDKIGNIRLNKDFTLKNVFYVLNSNLI